MLKVMFKNRIFFNPLVMQACYLMKHVACMSQDRGKGYNETWLMRSQNIHFWIRQISTALYIYSSVMYF